MQEIEQVLLTRATIEWQRCTPCTKPCFGILAAMPEREQMQFCPVPRAMLRDRRQRHSAGELSLDFVASVLHPPIVIVPVDLHRLADFFLNRRSDFVLSEIWRAFDLGRLLSV
jgi:hypothetical protein